MPIVFVCSTLDHLLLNYIDEIVCIAIDVSLAFQNELYCQVHRVPLGLLVALLIRSSPVASF